MKSWTHGIKKGQTVHKAAAGQKDRHSIIRDQETGIQGAIRRGGTRKKITFNIESGQFTQKYIYAKSKHRYILLLKVSVSVHISRKDAKYEVMSLV